MSLASKVKARANAFKRVRAFFEARDMLEVDTNYLSPHPSLDPYSEAMRVGDFYLHTSPERAMKKLLSCDLKDIYQICHVFRKDECGRLHSPEFTLIEYYRDLPYTAFIQECVELINLFIPGKASYTTYQNALTKFAPKDFDDENIAWGTHVEPNFKELTVVTGYAPSDLAKQRFEIYYRGVELANGYDEATDFPYNIPACCGVALGFDRLLMLQEEKSSIQGVIATPAPADSGAQLQTTFS
ncbi:MAG: Elongation factor P--(R)-beta-lysine ligase [Chlamydiia bacterium]|nr:Elongation factor P--(R)-beta-lysine ligase [Chlamydiia bacterium]MCH9614960.1 Elongation factor P--(R)-beta-lysine ligase [Chlamydiia bacterium]MCH9629990.1 Elongation factor P--(R)-beta-lysine ligase [Chlamydiia bacterium]